MNAPNRTLKQRAYRGMKEYFFISCYLWLVFALFVLYRSIILAEHHISFAANGFALINALALAKVLVVARELHFAEGFKEAPLIYPTLFKSIAFAIVLGCFKILEETVVGLYRGQSFSESITAIGGGTLKGILSLMAILTVLLVPFFGYTELRQVLGEGTLEKLFFTSRHHTNLSS
ncbi:MAG TPA: hypothetical protein VK798_02775 [Alloacidobacterium sp.]|jgi:hypothetical protein|nr:hypothetical protein [Alloacidobacterium sp.]